MPLYTIVLLDKDTTYVSSLLCSNTRRTTYSLLSNASPASKFFGFFTNACKIQGIQSTAFFPRIEGLVGTFLQPRNSNPSFFTIISNIFMAWFLSSSFCGKKNMPIPYSLSFPISNPNGFTAFWKNLWEICSIMPTPSPVFPSASFPARCSKFSTILSAFSTVWCDRTPFILTTAPIPQLSCSNSF